MSFQINPVTLQGRLVRLETMTPEHLTGLVQAATHGPRDTFSLTTVPASPEKMLEYMQEALRGLEANTVLPFVTVDQARNQVVGSTRFANFEFLGWPESSALYRPDMPDAVEIGWTWLAQHAQRSGINTEAKLLMLQHAFEVFAVRCLRLKTDARNLRSRNAIERLGAKFDGVLRVHARAADGGIRDSAYYSIIDSEWPQVKARLEGLLDVYARV